jgi:hypothetical protein
MEQFYFLNAKKEKKKKKKDVGIINFFLIIKKNYKIKI